MTRLDPVDRQLLDFLCSVEASRHCIVRSVKTKLRPSLRRLRYAGLVSLESYAPSVSALADWHRRKFPQSPPSPGGAAGEEQPMPKAAVEDGGAAARLERAAPPKAETFRCGHPKTPENSQSVGPYRGPACKQCRTKRWRETYAARKAARDAEQRVRAPSAAAIRGQRVAAKVRRATTAKAMERIEQGLDAKTAKQATVRHAQFALEAELEMKTRLSDPIEQAKQRLQKRYSIVCSEAVYGGDPDLFVVGSRKGVTRDQLLDMAGRMAA